VSESTEAPNVSLTGVSLEMPPFMSNPDEKLYSCLCIPKTRKKKADARVQP